MKETSKATIRRLYDARFVNTYFVGNGIDIGCGDDSIQKYSTQFPLISNVKSYDMSDGNAQTMSNIQDDTFDFVYSSHCLEHLNDPYEAFENWIRICKSGGHIITTVPDEDLYEQGVWPSTFNTDHKTTWTILKNESWSPKSINILEFLYQFSEDIEVLKIELINNTFIYNQKRFDQTFHSNSECAIEFIVRKKTDNEKKFKGRIFKN